MENIVIQPNSTKFNQILKHNFELLISQIVQILNSSQMFKSNFLMAAGGGKTTINPDESKKDIIPSKVLVSEPPKTSETQEKPST